MLGACDDDVAATCITRCLLNGAEQLPANPVAPRRPTYGKGRARDKDPAVASRGEFGEPPRDIRRPHRVAELSEQLSEGLGVGINRITDMESHLSPAPGYAYPDATW